MSPIFRDLRREVHENPAALLLFYVIGFYLGWTFWRIFA